MANIATIDWDAIELLPRFRCCVCTATTVPWGRTLDDRYFCSKGCSDMHAHAIPARPSSQRRTFSSPIELRDLTIIHIPIANIVANSPIQSHAPPAVH